MFYQALWQDRPGVVGLADADPPQDELRELKRRRRHGGVVKEWIPWSYRLVNGDFFDYQPEVFGLRLCSDKLKGIIEEQRSETDLVQWLPVRVVHENGEIRPYWILHFPDPPDVVDETLLRGGQAVHRVINLKRASGHDVLPAPGGPGPTFVVSKRLREALETGGCTGLIFQGVECS